jgi:IS5 family transposase
MFRVLNSQEDLFDFVTEPIFKRIHDPELDRIKEILDEGIFQEFFQELFRHEERKRDFGRPTKPLDVVIKLLILRRLYRWHYRETEKMGNDSLSVRKFLGLRDEAAPDHSVLSRWNKRIPEALWKKLNRAIVRYGKDKGITRGRKMRTDTTVVEGNIHRPSDSHLLMDGIRKLGKLAGRVKRLGLLRGEKVRDFSRSAKKQVLSIVKYAIKRTEETEASSRKAYENLVAITKRALSYAKEVETRVLEKVKTIRCSRRKKVVRLLSQYKMFMPRIQEVINQTVRRVFCGEKVPNEDKRISLFESHLYPVKRGKRTKPVEFGQVIQVQESEGGLLTDWEVFRSKPSDSELFISAIERHQVLFGRVPHLGAGDRGFWSQTNEDKAKSMGVQKVCIPKRGKKNGERTSLEKSRWFKMGMRFRTGSEATISVLKRRHGLDRCLDRGQAGMDSWIALGCISRNLLNIAHSIP